MYYKFDFFLGGGGKVTNDGSQNKTVEEFHQATVKIVLQVNAGSVVIKISMFRIILKLFSHVTHYILLR